MPSISDQVRQIICESKMSAYSIWMAAGIDQSRMSRFLAGKARLSMERLDGNGEFLNLQVLKGKSKGR